MGVKRTNTRHPWDAQPMESEKAYRWFCRYRDYGEHRSYATIVREFGGKPSYVRQLQRWASKYQWQDRVRAFDASIGERAAEVIADERIDMARRLARLEERYLLRLEEVVDALHPEDARWSEVTSALKAIGERVRATEDTTSSTGGKIVRVPNNGRGDNG